MIFAYPNAAGGEIMDVLARDHFLAALNDAAFELKLRESSEVSTLDSVLRSALRFEAFKKRVEQNSAIQAERQEGRNDPTRGRKPENTFRPRVAHVEKIGTSDEVSTDMKQQMRELIRDEMMNFSQRFEQMRNREDELRKELDRFRLLEQQRQWSAVTQPVASAEAKKPRNNQKKEGCYNCGSLDHGYRFCKKEKVNSGGDATEGESAQVKIVFGAAKRSEASGGARSCLGLRIRKREIVALCDSGSAVNLLPEELVPPSWISPSHIRLKAANGTEIPIVGRATLYSFKGRHRLRIEGLVTKYVSRVILGVE